MIIRNPCLRAMLIKGVLKRQVLALWRGASQLPPSHRIDIQSGLAYHGTETSDWSSYPDELPHNIKRRLREEENAS